jgi:hypothetical protein
MTKVYLAQMKWCEREEPICIGRNKRKVAQYALKLMKEKHGTGPVCRGAAFCQVRITMDDIEVIEIPCISDL